ncbi:MAG: cysteine hydrolase [Eubacterium sp.]|nr:cysteine hydrolase [Eubacterium sp.]
MQKFLIVVDMQKDFIDGTLGTAEAVKIVPAVKARIEKALLEGEKVVFTRDTHREDYLSTQEGKNLPVVHCIENTEGWQISSELRALSETKGVKVINKPTFGSRVLAEYLAAENEIEEISEITLIGLCTDICVISNAMMIKAFLTEVPVKVVADCCAGVTPESHENALKAMTMCQIAVE